MSSREHGQLCILPFNLEDFTVRIHCLRHSVIAWARILYKLSCSTTKDIVIPNLCGKLKENSKECFKIMTLITFMNEFRVVDCVIELCGPPAEEAQTYKS